MLGELIEPDSASGVARRVGLPRQQVNYHLRELEKEGLVQFVEERRKGNCLERVVRASAHSYVISPEVLGALGKTPAERQDRFSIGYLVSLAARMIRDLSLLKQRAEQANKRLATLAIETEIRFASAADRTAFAEDLTQAIATLAAKYNHATASGGRDFRIVTSVYPTFKE